MIDIDRYEEHYGMTYEQLLKRYKDLEVDDYKDLLAKVKRLREGRLDLINEVVRIINNKTGERVDADLHDYIIDRLVNE